MAIDKLAAASIFEEASEPLNDGDKIAAAAAVQFARAPLAACGNDDRRRASAKAAAQVWSLPNTSHQLALMQIAFSQSAATDALRARARARIAAAREFKSKDVALKRNQVEPKISAANECERADRRACKFDYAQTRERAQMKAKHT